MRALVSACLFLTMTACNCGGGDGENDGGVDAGSMVQDAGAPDAGQPDAGQPDAGEPDAGQPDAGEPDAGPPDAGEPDAGVADAGRGPPSFCPTPEAGAADAGVCAVGFADCDANPADCETATSANPLNCGRCGRVCGGTATCNAGLCGATLLMDPDVASNYCAGLFTTDRLFTLTCWGDNNLSELRTAPLEPGSDVRGTSLVAYNNVPLGAMRGLLLDGADVLFGLEGNPSRVFQVSASGTGPITTRFETDAGTRFDSLKVVDDTYYWIHNRHTAAGMVAPGGTIKRRGRSETRDTTLVSGLGNSYNLIVTPDKLLWMERRTAASGVSLYEAPRGGTGGDAGLITEVVAATSGSYLVRWGDFVYWTVKSAAPNGAVRRYEFGHPDAVPQDVVTGLSLPEGLTTDGSYLYFKQGDAMYRVGMCGGVPQQLSPVVPAHDSQATEVYAADSRYVYWTAGPGFGDSKIYRVAK